MDPAVPMPPDSGREKVVILGGGMAALSAAFALTDRPGWSDRFEVTVYQMGWRLGGKGASGRGAAAHDRIEEHGLHVWGGFYENAFHLMRRCYAELGRPADAPLATWLHAFRPHNFVVWEEFIDGKWIHWPVEMPANGLLPGEGYELLPPWEYLRMALAWMLGAIRGSRHGSVPAGASRSSFLPGWLEEVLHGVSPFWGDESAAAHPTLVERFEHTFLDLAHHLVGSAGPDVEEHRAAEHQGILWLLGSYMDWFYARIEQDIDQDPETRRLWCLLDFAAAAIRGILADGVLVRGFDAINDMDLVAWLRKHGASELTLGCAAVRAYYDYFFAFEGGDVDRPSLAAGSGMLHLVRLTLTYKTAIFWKMQAGMGDAVFAPLYEVLRRRGVRFRFFHRVHGLGLSADKGSIASIRIGRQATLKDTEYRPLVDVKGLPCWPSEPLYDQLVEGEVLKARGIDLESPWSPWADVEEVTLRAGVDFDRVVLGITLAPLRSICAELIAEDPAWAAMIDNLRTTQTLAVQLWFGPDAEGLGWTMGRAVGAGYAQPMDSWADFSNLIDREAWPAVATPGNLTYFCGPLQDADVIPGYSDHGFPARERGRVKEIAIGYLRDYAAHLWPAAASGADPSGLDWAALMDTGGQQGVARFDAQYWRANISPAERYVLSVPGDSRYRLRPDESGFANLVLAGDWTFTGLGGCIEAAAMSGMMASRAIAGYPERIVGEVSRR